MMLDTLYLSRDTFGQNKGRLTGRVKFTNGAGEIQLNLAPDTAEKILAIVADALVDAARETAQAMTAQIINATAALPAKDAA